MRRNVASKIIIERYSTPEDKKTIDEAFAKDQNQGLYDALSKMKCVGSIQIPGDVWLPTTDQRWLVMPRFTQPEPDQAILLHKLHLELPHQPPPRIKARVPDFLPEALRM